MDAGKRTINDLFNGNRVLSIPFFQRSYVWGEEQWERLLEDMEMITAVNKPHFLGSVILKQQETNSKSEVGDIRTVIDGQQRLTTLNIFFKVLCLKTNAQSSFDRRFRLESGALALWHNHNDIEVFERVLGLEKLECLQEPKNNNSIIGAYEYFRENLRPEKVDRQKLLNNIIFVGIDLGKDEDEQQIFDTINSLGVRLTTAELLKNHFFNRDELDMYEKYWKCIFEKDEETKKYWDKEITTGRVKRTFIDLFFYAYLQIKVQQPDLQVRAEDKIEYSKVDSLFESYKQFIKEHQLNKKELLTEIKEYAEKFQRNFDPEIINKELTADPGMDRINAIIFGLENSTLIPYILFVLKEVPEEVRRNELFDFIETFILRRMVVRASTKNYNQLFTDRLIANRILSKKQFQEFIENQSDKVNYLPEDEELKNGFDQSVLINRQTAGIIYFLESRIRNRPLHATQLLGLKKYSLEHLMPKKWENNWSHPTTREQAEERKFKLLTLGNLTIITQALNASIRDGNWEVKKAGNGRKQGLRHFCGGIETLSPYLDLPEWNEEQIARRAEQLYQIALKFWRYEELPVGREHAFPKNAG